ncbi:TolC family protein [Pseudoxanthomonas sp. LH2527]|uniref:TolC family protein n=1 Tax=Pseudoxanthomonas sp. LH2527 TaxID=2923249 RepID=UPI001F138057|nr:TolC family protein [Pseudoxanthomonas sp. LH2527]MCH6483514.1 TolC family protein [Pseudoxanthomonas sp. LH2527]
MWLRLAALAAFAIAPCVHAQAPSPAVPLEILTLDDAIARVARVHPDLRLFGPRTQALLAEREAALLRPALRAGLEVENVLGTGDASGFRQAEATLTLAGVLERGGKLDARRTLAQARIDALAMQRETQRLDLLADVARRYLAVAGARAQQAIAVQDIAQRRRTVAAARQRLQAGASPASVVLTAEAALARADLALARADHQAVAARQHLAALWGERAPRFEIAATDPLALAAIADANELAELLDGTPELTQFADEHRVREARVRLARTASTPDLDWQVGVRRLQDSGDITLVGSVSLALGGARRATPAIRVAEADLAALEMERESRDIALYATLTDAHGRYRLAQLDVQRTRDDVLPRLRRAEQAAERAYRAGAISYLEWAQLQSETTATRRQQLDAALEAQLALIELQRLTGQALVAMPMNPEQGTTP